MIDTKEKHETMLDGIDTIASTAKYAVKLVERRKYEQAVQDLKELQFLLDDFVKDYERKV